MSDKKGLPYFASGTVVKGFGRGSKELGCPTANFDANVVKELPTYIDTGIYIGWAQVDTGPVHKMVMCVGWNPYYKNVEKSMETHILHKFSEDFYGHCLKVCVVGYLRPERDFSSLDELIKQIECDISQAEKQLEQPMCSTFQKHSFFNVTENQPV